MEHLFPCLADQLYETNDDDELHFACITMLLTKDFPCSLNRSNVGNAKRTRTCTSRTCITIQHNTHTYLLNLCPRNKFTRPSASPQPIYLSIYLSIHLSYLYRTCTERTYQPSVKNKYRISAYLPRHRKKERKKKSFFRPKTLDLREILGSKDLMAIYHQHT